MESAIETQTDRMNPPTPTNQLVRTILVAIDGSESADDALHAAKQLAEKFTAEIDIIHVSETLAEKAVIDSGGGSTTDALQQSHSPAQEMLLERMRLLETSGLTSKTVFVTSTDGSAGDEILKRAAVGRYDLLVTGSRGLGRARSFFLGSVSKKVVTEAKCSVLVSKNRIDSIKRILLAYDGSEGSKKALTMVADLAKRFGAIVNVVSAISEPMLSSELDVRAAVDRLDKEMRYYTNQASSALKELGVNSEIAKVAGARKISIAITREAEEGSYDIVALGSRGWGKAKSMLLGSVAASVLDSCKANLLIVR